jgi:hypothetical protein
MTTRRLLAGTFALLCLSLAGCRSASDVRERLGPADTPPGAPYTITGLPGQRGASWGWAFNAAGSRSGRD